MTLLQEASAVLHPEPTAQWYILSIFCPVWGLNSLAQYLAARKKCVWKTKYRKVASRSTSRLVARPRIFRLFMKGKFDAYVLWPLAFDLWPLIVDRSTARDFTVSVPIILTKLRLVLWKSCYKALTFEVGDFSMSYAVWNKQHRIQYCWKDS